MFFRKQREIERLSQRCFELGEQLSKKNKENKELKQSKEMDSKTKGRE